MKLQRETTGALNAFSAYGPGYVIVGGQRFERSIVVLPERIIPDWAATTFESLAAEHLAALSGLGSEILLLGTGARLRFPSREILAPLMEAGIGIEVMDVPAACRTFNILMAEERRVAAALLLG